jgi:hypothetical protein
MAGKGKAGPVITMSGKPIYQIADWNEHFENSRSREIESCTWVATPNKHHGTGFQRILASQDGMAMYGLWCLIVQACSRQRAAGQRRRNGWLTDDGTAAGHPWDAADLAERWRQPVDLVQYGLDLFCSPRIGWLLAHDHLPIDEAPNDSHLPSGHRSPGTLKSSDIEDGDTRQPRRATRREAKRTEVNGTSPPSSTAIFRIQAVDADRLRQAIDQHDLMGVVKSFGGNVASDRQVEWAREADQMTLFAIAAIFAWRRDLRDLIREPSGLRRALEQWRTIPSEERRTMAVALLKDYGIAAPVVAEPRAAADSTPAADAGAERAP